jgi:hypothetical protein
LEEAKLSHPSQITSSQFEVLNCGKLGRVLSLLIGELADGGEQMQPTREMKS